ncbi:MAG: SDR family oxidoreductase [Caldisphaera sp.]|jgi:3-oxoacyl-[acyl-carrier protein] reductase|nr:SDR family oxidoreductase [Caldisphaera sp.]PMP60470.1 MAG: short-chain dehydrogenase [Caldisphaera sp.]PMP90485.1 MAG: short-chain dehydrogenase [Caldisphaera sp.]
MKIIVTASTKGIGYGISKVLLENGNDVVISGHNERNLESALDSLKSYGKIHGILADLRNINDIKNLVDESINILKGLDALVYVAPPPKPGNFEDTPIEAWDEAVKSLLLSAVWITKISLPYIKESKGSYVYLSSFAIKEPQENLILSNVVRISLAGLTKSLSKELGKYGIKVNMIMPGWIETERVEEVVNSKTKKEGKDKKDIIKEIEFEIPLKRMAKPEEIGDLVNYLIAKNTYVSGASIPFDGGLLNSVF